MTMIGETAAAMSIAARIVTIGRKVFRPPFSLRPTLRRDSCEMRARRFVWDVDASRQFKLGHFDRLGPGEVVYLTIPTTFSNAGLPVTVQYRRWPHGKRRSRELSMPPGPPR